MKSVLLLLCICMMMCSPELSFGAFLIKRVEVNSHVVAMHNKTARITAADYRTGRVSRFMHKMSMLLYKPHDPNTDIINEKGTFGTLALIFGCLSFIPLYGILFGTAAIILGFVGKHYHQRFSRVGILLGIVGIAANAFFISILIMEALNYVPIVAI